MYQSGEKVRGIINEPDVYEIELGDEVVFLILASDGICNPLKDQFAVTHARRALRTLFSSFQSLCPRGPRGLV